jgi:aspartokinase/homoserine dehydrogenase 1
MALQVIKFGGSSLKDSEAISQVLDVVSLHKDQLVVVLSAMGGMTDLLLSAAKAATKGDPVDEACDQFRQRHSEVINNLIADPKTKESLNKEVEVTTREFRDICTSLKTLQESTQGILDRTAARGERLIGSIFTGLLNERQRPARFIDATDVIKVRVEAGQSGPDLEETTALLKSKVQPHVQSQVIVIPGFIGSNSENQLVTLGRSGSDLSATVIGHGLKADE